MRETVDTIASPETGARPASPRRVGSSDFTADGADERRWDAVAVGCDSSHRSDNLGWNVLGEYADHGGSFWWVDVKERGYVWEGMTTLAAIEGANPATGAAGDAAGALSGWDSPRARFGGDCVSLGVAEDVAHAALPGGDALAWYSPLGGGWETSGRGNGAVGRPAITVGAAGEVLAMVGYGPYGAPSTHNAGAAPAFSYTGKPYDAATGLYHFPYRQYDPNAARWLTRDPLGMVDGPNVYAYVMGNPVGAVDPLGTYSVECTGWSSESCGFWFRRWCEMIKWGHYDVLEDDDGCTKCRCCWRTNLDCLDIAAKRFEFAVARCQGDGNCLERAKRRYEKDAAKCAIEGL